MATAAQIISAQRQPQAIRNAWNKIVVACDDEVFLGIIGDSNHGSGYHMSFNYCWYVGDYRYGQDYSCQHQRDKNGDPDACRALDIGWGGANETHWRVTQHVIDRLAAGDPRLRGVRQVLGSTGFGTTVGYDVATGRYNTPDSSHRTHLHTSFWGDSVDDQAAMDGFAEVVIEGANGSTSIGGGLTEGDPFMSWENARDELLTRFDQTVIPLLQDIRSGTFIRFDQTVIPGLSNLRDEVVGRIDTEVRPGISHAHSLIATLTGQVTALQALIGTMGTSGPLTPAQFTELLDKTTSAAEKGAKDALENLTLVTQEDEAS